MKLLKILFILLFLANVAAAQTGGDILQFKARIGFDETKERIAAKQFSDDGTKLTLIGLKSIQVWDIPTAKLLKSYPHEIVELDKFYGTTYEINPDGSKVITLDSIGRDSDKKEDRVNAYAFDIQTGKRIAVLERPDYSVRFASWSADGETLVTFSGLYRQKQTEISFWNGADLAFRQSIVVDGFSWHRLSPDGERLYVGNGGRLKLFGFPVNGAGEGEIIRAFNTRTGAVEKTFNDLGEGFEVEDTYTFVSPDGRFIAAAKNKNTIVWDANGKSQPLYELTAPNGKNRMSPRGFSDDGKYLFIRQDGVDEYYDAATGQLVSDVPKLVKLRRENEYVVEKFDNGNLIDFINHTRFRRADSVLLTPDGRYAVTIPCAEATVLDLTANRNLYTVESSCHGSSDGNQVYGKAVRDTYLYSYDVFRLSPNGNLLINFRYDQFVVRDLKTGTILQRILRKQDENMQDPPRGNIQWDFKGKYALTVSGDDKSMLIWEINEN